MAQPAPLPPALKVDRVAVNNGSNRISTLLGATTTPGTDSSSLPLSETHQLVQNINPGATLLIPIAGISYYFEFIGTLAGVANTKLLQVRAVNRGQPRAPILHVMGTGLRFGTQSFTGIEITNPDLANPVRFTVDIGGGIPNQSYDEFIDKRVIISQTGGTITVTTAAGAFLSCLVKNEPTVSVGFTTRVGAWADSLAGGASQAVADGYLGLSRKSIIFANDDAVAVLQVLDPTGNILGTVQPSTSWTTDTGGTLTLKNPTGGAVTCHIGEIYYTA